MPRLYFQIMEWTYSKEHGKSIWISSYHQNETLRASKYQWHHIQHHQMCCVGKCPWSAQLGDDNNGIGVFSSVMMIQDGQKCDHYFQ